MPHKSQRVGCERPAVSWCKVGRRYFNLLLLPVLLVLMTVSALAVWRGQEEEIPNARPAENRAIEVVPKPAIFPENGEKCCGITAPMDWEVHYALWQSGISAGSSPLAIKLSHGRADVTRYRHYIIGLASRDLQLITAAAIAHQASDLKDRPFGVDTIEEVWRSYVDENASVGIAQLRPSEVPDWAPRLAGQDLLDPAIAVGVMAAKLRTADRYILQHEQPISTSDRYMLLALVQNMTSESSAQVAIDSFIVENRRSWRRTLASEMAEHGDWLEQLRLMLVQIEWLAGQGWEVPAGLDLEYWRLVAFGD